MERVLEAIRSRLLPARRFFSGAVARLEPGNRVATWQQWAELVAALRECGLEVELPGVADGAGVPAPPSGPEQVRGSRAVLGSALLARDPSQAGDGWPVSGAFARQPGARTLLVRRTLRSGQRVSFDGNVVVLGDVNPGAEVVASGDIVVVGALRGMAHAGARGDEGAVVVALDLRPVQLRIAHRVARSPEGASRAPARGPEVARIRGEAVEVVSYGETLRGGTG